MMIFKILQILLFLAVGFSLPAHANVVIDTSNLKIKTIPASDGELPDIDFGDGKIAKLVLLNGPMHPFKFDMQISETTCTTVTPIKCQIKYPILINRLQLIWKAHSDPQKIGQLVIDKTQRELFNEFRFFSFSDELNYYDFLLSKGYKSPEFSCPNWQWLGFDSDSIHLHEWSSETMGKNFETDSSENLTFSAVLDMDLTRQDKTTYKIGYPNRLVKRGTQSEDFYLIQGDIIGWTIDLGNLNSCEVAFKPEAGEAINALDKIKLQPPMALKENNPHWKKLKISGGNSVNQESLKYIAGRDDLLLLAALRLAYFSYGKNGDNEVITVNQYHLDLP